VTETGAPRTAAAGAVTAAKPSLELLRELSDEHVLRALMTQDRMTRAELAACTGISKPTVGESVRRLEAAGVVADTGTRSTGRGRAGSYYALAGDVGCALAVSIAPEAIAAEIVDAHGAVAARATEHVRRPVRPEQVTASVREAGRRVHAEVRAPVRLAVVTAAGPVDRLTGRLLPLPDAPFLLGELSPAQALADLVAGPVLVDNDVNWAARAERAAAGGGPMNDFAYLYLGEGLGCAVVSDGEVRRGHGGLAGEIAHVVTTGQRGRAMAFIDVFADLGVRQPGSTAIDVAGLITAVTGSGRAERAARDVLGVAVAGVVSAAVALTDPRVVVIGGTWGSHPAVLEAVQAACERLARPVALRPALVTQEAPLAGARAKAVRDLRWVITHYRQTLRHNDPERAAPGA
jgi:predicted NBD/HSP70 family sugar kinase